MVAVSVLLVDGALSDELPKIGELQFPDDLEEPTQVSGIAVVDDGDRLFVVADEKHHLQILRRASLSRYELESVVSVLPAGDNDEADLEALAVADGWLYLVGSHSAKREQVKAGKFTRAENIARHRDTDKEKARRQLLRVRVDADFDNQPRFERSSLWERIEDDPLLKPFTAIPSKENGVDIEGIAVDGERLLIGFRSPVLRGGYAVVMETKFDSVSADLLFVDLGGLGIRDMLCIAPDSFLLLCGPPGDVPGECLLKLWNGKDTTPGKDGAAPGEILELGVVPRGGADAKAEGVSVLRRTEQSLDVLVVYDGVDAGAPTVLRLALIEN